MTKSELIECLQSFPGDDHVLIEYGKSKRYYRLRNITIGSAVPQTAKHWDWDYQSPYTNDERESNQYIILAWR